MTKLFRSFSKRSLLPLAAAGLTLLAVSLITGAAPAAAFEARTGQLHIVKDCRVPTNPPTTNTCQIVSSNLAELPPGSLIFYADPNALPGTPGIVGARGVMDSTIFIYVASGDWAVGRCTLDMNTGLGVCTLSYGSGPLATISVTANVTRVSPGLFNLDGTYTFNPSGE